MLALMMAVIAEDISDGPHIGTFTDGQREMATTQPEQTPVQMQHRARVPKLRHHIAASPVRMERQPRRPFRKAAVQRGVPRHWRAGRSEEHTSELQSLMRISYAVFCFQKKKQFSL